ncbi:conserved hypothetical protein [uncultured Citrobacter sp.]|uniref:Uncharacterized protein n=1 Tax=uncultured Citrobacter sp. TaxID=200446 RepID=A0A212IPM1_9ENTR|nr:conserved hypothetical protein [uncultured Citrobacter sp.]
MLIANIADLRDLRIEMTLLFIQILDIKIRNSRLQESGPHESGGTDEQNFIVHKSLCLFVTQETYDKDERLP